MPASGPPPGTGPRPDQGPDHAGGLPRAVWALGGVSLLMDTSSEMIHSLLPVFLVSTLGAGTIALGAIEGIAESTALLVKMFSGVWSDRVGRRKGLAVAGYGLSALTKPLFALATSVGLVLGARVADRVGKGVRGAPRDALVADLAPPERRGAAFGLRQSLDTVGASLGPLIAVGLMLLWSDDVRAVFRVAVIPAVLAVALLVVGVREPPRQTATRSSFPLHRESLRKLTAGYWRVVAIGTAFTLARFSEAFLVLRAMRSGVPVALVPLVMVVMNLVYAATAYPFGRLADRVPHTRLLALGLVVLIGSDLVLTGADRPWIVLVGVALWGAHMGLTQGLLAAMVAGVAPPELRGTAFGLFHLASGMATLVASLVAGLLWARLGAPATFLAGAVFGCAALAGLGWRSGARREARGVTR